MEANLLHAWVICWVQQSFLCWQVILVAAVFIVSIFSQHSGHTAENHAGDRGKDQDKNIEADLGEDLVECADWDTDWDIDEDVGGDVGGHFAEDGGDGNDIDENIRGGAADGDAVGENDSSSIPLFQVQEGQVSIFLESVVHFLLK